MLSKLFLAIFLALLQTSPAAADRDERRSQRDRQRDRQHSRRCENSGAIVYRRERGVFSNSTCVNIPNQGDQAPSVIVNDGFIATGRAAELIASGSSGRAEIAPQAAPNFDVLPIFSGRQFLGTALRYSDGSNAIYLTPLHVLAGEDLPSLRIYDVQAGRVVANALTIDGVSLPTDIREGNRLIWEQNDFALLKLSGQTIQPLAHWHITREIHNGSQAVELSFPGDVEFPSENQVHLGTITGSDGGLLRFVGAGLNPGSSGGGIATVPNTANAGGTLLTAMSLCRVQGTRDQITTRAITISSILERLIEMHRRENYQSQIPTDLTVSERYRQRCDPVGEKGGGDG